MRRRRRPKQRIDPRPVAILASSLRDQNVILFDQKVVIGGADIDSAFSKPLAVRGHGALKSPVFPEARQQSGTRVLRSHV